MFEFKITNDEIENQGAIKASYIDARCGAGKTRHVLKMMATTPKCWVYAVDRKDVIEDRSKDIEAFAAEAGVTTPAIRSVHSETENRARKPVSERIWRAVEEFRGVDHSIIIITHAGLNES